MKLLLSLRFILLFMFLFCFGFYSIASAYTWEDFIDFLSYSKNKETAIVDNTQKSYATYLINNSTSIKQAIINKGINVDDYDCFLVTQTTGYYYYIYMYKNITQYSIDNNSKLTIKGGQKAIIRTDIDGMYKSTSNTANAGDNFSMPYGLVEGTPTNSNYYNACMQNIWVSFIARGTSQTYSSINEVLPLFDGLVGSSEDYNNLEYKLYYLDASNTKQYITANTITQYITQGTNGYIVTINSNAIGIPNGETIYLDVFKNNTLLTSSDGIIVRIERDTSNDSPIIENTSGDKFIDLTNTNNKIQEVTNSIISGDNRIIAVLESGEQKAEERNNFWVDTYNDLFTLNSGDVNDLYLTISSYFPSGDTPISIYETIFGGLNNEPDDFIIRWDDVDFNMTYNGGEYTVSGDFIQAGSINFSKMCRDNQTLGLVKFWVNTLFTIFFLLTVYSTFYEGICNILNVIDMSPPDDSYKRHKIGFGVDR